MPLTRSTAHRWTARLFVGVAALAIGCSSPPGAAGVADASVSPDAGNFPSPCGRVFCEEASRVGLHAGGSAYGRGAAFVDVDGDGWEDLWQSDSGGASRLYRNRGDGTFAVMEVGIDPANVTNNWGGIWGDVDNDGDPDLFLVNGGYEGEIPCALYRNDLSDSGGFADITAEAGILPTATDWWGGSFADYDGDSYLDLVVTSAGLRAMPPLLVLYHNQGDGTFVDVSDEVGLPVLDQETKNPLWFDYDRDGDPDLYVTVGIRGEHVLMRNDGAGGFTRVPFVLDPVPAEDESFLVIHGFSGAVADFDQDGWDDLYLGRWYYQDYIFLNNGDGTFRRRGAEVGLDMGLFPYPEENTMGLAVGDINEDGWPDLLLGTGEPLISRAPLAYCSTGQGLGFDRCADDFVAGHGDSWHHGAAFADPDHDGDTDIFWSVGGHLEGGAFEAELPLYYVRYPKEPPSAAVVHLVGTASNRSAVGARIEVVGSDTHYYAIRSAAGFQSQNSDWVSMTLGSSSTGTVTVSWPSGAESVVEVSAGDRIEIVE